LLSKVDDRRPNKIGGEVEEWWSGQLIGGEVEKWRSGELIADWNSLKNQS
jgi:hypothetical protein